MQDSGVPGNSTFTLYIAEESVIFMNLIYLRVIKQQTGLKDSSDALRVNSTLTHLLILNLN